MIDQSLIVHRSRQSLRPPESLFLQPSRRYRLPIDERCAWPRRGFDGDSSSRTTYQTDTRGDIARIRTEGRGFMDWRIVPANKWISLTLVVVALATTQGAELVCHYAADSARSACDHCRSLAHEDLSPVSCPCPPQCWCHSQVDSAVQLIETARSTRSSAVGAIEIALAATVRLSEPRDSLLVWYRVLASGPSTAVARCALLCSFQI